MSITVVTRARASALILCGAAVGSIAAPGFAQANAPITVLAAVAVKGALDEIGPLFERSTGRRLDVVYDSPASFTRRFAEGEVFDVVIAGAAAVDGWTKTGVLAAGSETTVGSSVASLAYKHGMPVPDISTPDALKTLVLNAKSISYSDPALGGASTVYFLGILQRLGISDAVQQKATLTKPGEGAVPVGSGQTEIGIALSSEIAMVPGVDGVPLFPADPRSTLIEVAAVSTKSTQPDGARAFIQFLLSPDGTAIRKAKGL